MERPLKLKSIVTKIETEPDRPYYISYDDHGKTYLKCSG